MPNKYIKPYVCKARGDTFVVIARLKAIMGNTLNHLMKPVWEVLFSGI